MKNTTPKKTEITKENFFRLKPGALSDDYEMVKKISKATFGDIYLVYHNKTKTKRCLKVYKKMKMESTNQNKFEEEIELIKKLDHPNIFEIYEFYDDEETFYLITEYLEGGELFDFISSSGELNEKLAFIIIEQVLSAVNYLHKHNIIHRDLKPENLLLVTKNDPTKIKLIDFGTSKKFKKGDILSNPLGTCYYVAPEVIRRGYNEGADIWSCGVILYILLCGYPPFNGKNETEIFLSILKNEVKFDEKDWGGISEDAIDLVYNMLRKFPVQRFTMKQCLNHPWFINNDKNYNNFNESVNLKVVSRLRTLNIKNKFEKALRIFMVQYFDLKEEKNKLLMHFKKFDKNHDGMICKDELAEVFKNDNCIFDKFDTENLLKMLDVNKDQMINYSEFLMATYNFKKFLNKNVIKTIFEMIDENNDGSISVGELRDFLNLDEKDPLIMEIYKEADLNGDGVIDSNEFNRCIGNIFEMTNF